MKKLLNMLALFSLFPLFSLNTTSCFMRNDKTESVFDKINNANNIEVAGINLEKDTTNDNTKKIILDSIGLTAKEQREVTISGSLMQNKESSINFKVNSEDIVKDVKWTTIVKSLPKDYKIKDSIIFKGILFTIVQSSATKDEEGVYKSEDGINFVLFKKGVFCNFSYNKSQDKLYISSTSLGLCTIDKNMSWKEYSGFKTYFVVSYEKYIYCILMDSSKDRIGFSISGDPNTMHKTEYYFEGTIVGNCNLAIYDNKIFVTNYDINLEWSPLAKKEDDNFTTNVISDDLAHSRLKMVDNKLFISTSNKSFNQIMPGDTPNVNHIDGSTPTSSNEVEDFCSDDNNYMYTCGDISEPGKASYIYYSKEVTTNYKSLDDFSKYNRINSIFSFKNFIMFDAELGSSYTMEAFLWNKYLLD